MKKDSTKSTALFGTLFLMYTALMLWLLFDRSPSDSGLGYWDQVRLNMNLVPTHTITLYCRLLFSGNDYWLRQSVINLGGNVGMFIPFGLLLPLIWPGLRKFWKCWLVCAGGIVLVEIAQLFTLLGSCDVDDLILNLVGISLGFGLYHLIFREPKEKPAPKTKPRKKKRSKKKA